MHLREGGRLGGERDRERYRKGDVETGRDREIERERD